MKFVAVLLLVAAVVSACGGGGSGDSPAPTPVVPTATVGPTATPTATLTPTASPTITPTPTVTPTPTPEPCSTDDGELVEDSLNDVAARWDDAFLLAQNTPRNQLATRIADLQEIRRDLNADTWPECGEKAQAALSTAMENGTNGFIAFLSQEPEHLVNSWFELYFINMDMFENAVAAIK